MVQLAVRIFPTVATTSETYALLNRFRDLPWQQRSQDMYLAGWWEIDQDTFDHFLAAMPPLAMGGGAYVMSEATTENVHAAFLTLSTEGKKRWFTGSIDRRGGVDPLREAIKVGLALEQSFAKTGLAPQEFSRLAVPVTDMHTYLPLPREVGAAKGIVYGPDLAIIRDDQPGMQRFIVNSGPAIEPFAVPTLQMAERALYDIALSEGRLPQEQSYSIELTASFTGRSVADVRAYSLAHAVALASQEDFSGFDFTLDEDPLPEGEHSIVVGAGPGFAGILIDARPSNAPRAEVAVSIVEQLASLDPDKLDQDAVARLIADARSSMKIAAPFKLPDLGRDLLDDTPSPE